MATTGAVFANSNAADGTLTGWTNPTYAYADDANFATRAGTTKSQWYGTLYGFDLSGIPDGATITSVTLLARWKNSANDTSGPVFLLGAKSGGSEVGTGTTDTTGTTSEENVTYQPTGLTAAALKATGATGFWAIARFRRTDNTAHTASLDYITCTVVYSVVHAITATDAASGVPVVESSTLGQKHVLTGSDVASGIPTIEQATLSQKHVLTAGDISTPAPILDSPVLVDVPAAGADELTATDITSGIPIVEQATLGQKHALTSADIVSGVPTVDQATLGQRHALTAVYIATPAPVVDSASIGQVHELISGNIFSGVPTVDKATAGITGLTYDLIATDIESGIPVISSPTLSGIQVSTDSAAAALFGRRTSKKDDDEVLAMYALLESEW